MDYIHAALVESLGEFTDINAWGVPGTCDAVFESVSMLDVEKQRRLIFDKYESQCAYFGRHYPERTGRFAEL